MEYLNQICDVKATDFGRLLYSSWPIIVFSRWESFGFSFERDWNRLARRLFYCACVASFRTVLLCHGLNLPKASMTDFSIVCNCCKLPLNITKPAVTRWYQKRQNFIIVLLLLLIFFTISYIYVEMCFTT